MPYKVYIIIVTYNGLSWIDQCLGSLRKSSIDVQVIVIDNGSSDGTQDYIQENYPEVEVVQSNENLGFGKANNIGLKRALEDDVDYVFLLNQDAWVESGCIEKLIEIHQNNPLYGILSPLQLNGTGDDLDFRFRKYLFRAEKGFAAMLGLSEQKDVYEVPFVNAAMWLISKPALLLVGGFDPIYTHYGEDDDYARRVLQAGLHVGIVLSVKGWHDRPQAEPVLLGQEYIDGLFKNELWRLLRNRECIAKTRFQLTVYFCRRILAGLFSVDKARPVRSEVFIQFFLLRKLLVNWNAIHASRMRGNKVEL
jgi:GT2 family glycosyltransferase